MLQPLLSMPSSDAMPLERGEDDEEEESESTSPRSTPYSRRVSLGRPGSVGARPGSVGLRPDSRISNAGRSSTLSSRPNSGMPQEDGRAKSLTRLNGLNGTSTKLTGLQRSTIVRYTLLLLFHCTSE